MVHPAQFLSIALIFSAQRSNLFIRKWWLISTRVTGVTQMHRFFTAESFSKLVLEGGDRDDLLFSSECYKSSSTYWSDIKQDFFWSFKKHCCYHGSHPCLVFMVSLFLTVRSGHLILSFLCEREQVVSMDSVMLAGLQMRQSKVLIERLTASLYYSLHFPPHLQRCSWQFHCLWSRFVRTKETDTQKKNINGVVQKFEKYSLSLSCSDSDDIKLSCQYGKYATTVCRQLA